MKKLSGRYMLGHIEEEKVFPSLNYILSPLSVIQKSLVSRKMSNLAS